MTRKDISWLGNHAHSTVLRNIPPPPPNETVICPSNSQNICGFISTNSQTKEEMTDKLLHVVTFNSKCISDKTIFCQSCDVPLYH